jgi:hypothetical protein
MCDVPLIHKRKLSLRNLFLEIFIIDCSMADVYFAYLLYCECGNKQLKGNSCCCADCNIRL